MTEHEYVPISLPERSELDEALLHDDAPALQSMVLGVSMYDGDEEFAADLSARLTVHPNEYVRGNAIQGLGHIARRFGQLRPELVEAIDSALLDPSEYVRGQAHGATDDVTHFLGVEFSNLKE